MSNDQNNDENVLGEMQRVLDQQVTLVQNQQNQAMKILRVSLTLAGLLLTLTSIAVTAFTSDITSNIFVFTDILSNISLTSAAFGFAVLYISVIIVGTFAVIFVSAFRVLSPVTGSDAGGSLSVQVLYPLLKSSVFLNTLKLYSRIFPVISLSVTELTGGDQISLRPGIDGDKSLEILDFDEDKQIEKILKYDAGCIDKNEELIEENRRLLSNVYTSSVILTFIFSLLILVGVVVLIPSPS
jgi:hypothetical protein